MEEAYDPDQTFGNGSKDEQEMDHNNLLFGTPQSSPRDPPRDQTLAPRNQHIQMPTATQMANYDGNAMMAVVQSLLAENQRINNKSGKRPQPYKDDEEEGEPPV